MATEQDALAKGYTVKALIEGDYETHEGLIKGDTDLDSIFTFYSLGEGAFTRCHGYNCTINLEGDD